MFINNFERTYLMHTYGYYYCVVLIEGRFLYLGDVAWKDMVVVLLY